MKFHTTSGNQAASPETTSSSPSESPTVPSPEKNPSNGSLFDQMLLHLPTAPVPEPFVNKSQLAIHYGVCERTIERWVAADMPRYYIGKREMRFRLSEVQLWLQQNHITRFAAHGIATTMAEVQRRIINIPILNGLEILQVPTDTTSRPNPPKPNGVQVMTPRCKPGRKSKTPGKVACDGNHHKWKTTRYTRTCAVCGVTEERDAKNNWVSTTTNN